MKNGRCFGSTALIHHSRGENSHTWAYGDVPFFRVPFWKFEADLWVSFQRSWRIYGYTFNVLGSCRIYGHIFNTRARLQLVYNCQQTNKCLVLTFVPWSFLFRPKRLSDLKQLYAFYLDLNDYATSSSYDLYDKQYTKMSSYSSLNGNLYSARVISSS